MKTIDLSARTLSLEQLTRMARRGAVLIRRGRGECFLVTRADDFETEVELLRRNHKFLAFLDQRFRNTRTTTLSSPYTWAQLPSLPEVLGYRRPSTILRTPSTALTTR